MHVLRPHAPRGLPRRDGPRHRVRNYDPVLLHGRAGTKRVYAVDVSKVAEMVKGVVRDNGSENAIMCVYSFLPLHWLTLQHVHSIIRGKMEDIALPDGDGA